MDYKELAESAFKHAKVFKAEGEFSKAVGLERYGTAITDLLARAEAAEAKVDCLMEELKAHSESDLAKAHDFLSADWAKQKMRADRAEKCIVEIEEALKFGRVSAAMLRIFEHRGQKEE